jgi:hypothetical protein
LPQGLPFLSCVHSGSELITKKSRSGRRLG